MSQILITCDVNGMDIVVGMAKRTTVVYMNSAVIDFTDWAEEHFKGFGDSDLVDLFIIGNGEGFGI